MSDHRFAKLIAAAAAVLGCVAAIQYARAGLTLSHYDAKAHLVVARRIIDSITPGWQQIGAVWLPLPHLLSLVPVQFDLVYRTGIFGVIVSIAAYATAMYGAVSLILFATRSRLAALAGSLVFALNPAMLYLQSTPMTEPLLIALSTMALLLVCRWIESGADVRPRAAGWLLAAVCLTRYEAWPVTVLALVLTTLALILQGRPVRDAVARIAGLTVYPLAAIAFFFIESKTTVGQWFVTGGFYIPDNTAEGHFFPAGVEVWWGAHVLTSYPVLLLAAAGSVGLLFRDVIWRRRPSSLVVLALAACVALPWYAYYRGHPFRIRYAIPLVPAVAVYAGIAAGLVRRSTAIASSLLIGLCLFSINLTARQVTINDPFDRASPMLVEAQWDNEHRFGRQRVIAYLRTHYDGEKIMASMASLAHVIQELSSAGLHVRDFLHEGNGDIWLTALASPRPFAGWIMMEIQSEGGDMLTRRAQDHPAFLDGFEPAIEGGGVVLYRRKR